MSVAIALNVTVAARVMWAGSDNAGAVVSTTLMMNVKSVQTTVVVPRGNVEPEAALQAPAGRPLKSSGPVPEELNVTVAPFGPVASTVIVCSVFGGGGGGDDCSTTLISNDPCAELPFESLAEQLTHVVPRGNFDPDAGAQVTGIDPSTLSSALASNVATVPVLSDV